MKKLWLLAAFVALTVACGGSGKEETDTQSQADTIAADDVAGDITQTTDTLLDEDLPLAETVEGDIPPADVPEPWGSPYSPEYLTKLCTDYCNADHACDIEYGETCVDDCIEAAKPGDAFLKKLACARNAIGDGEFCSALDECPGDYDMSEECIAMCADVDACGALETSFFGHNLDDCAMVCTSSIGLFEEGQAIMDCISEPLANCSGTEFIACIGEPDKEICEVDFCGAEVDPFCALVPEPYETTELCAADCADWSVGQMLAAESCLNLGTELPVDCAQTYANCFAVSDAPAANALDYCLLVADKCGGIGDDQLYQELGGLAHDFCAWQVTGVTAIKPDGFRPFDEAVECMESLSICPTGDLSGLYCLFDITEDHVTACAPVAELCTDETLAQEVTLECEGTLAFAAAFVPEAVEMISGCVAAAADCDALAECFFGDEEE